MFIELTDILRCPAPHDEHYLVLVPGEMSGRMVRRGRLGCPICRREYPIEDGEAVFSGEAGGLAGRSDATAEIDATALAAFLGLSGPGGYVGLVGDLAGVGAELIAQVPGVHFVGINAPAGTAELPMMSLVRSTSIPIRSRSLRGVMLGGGYADDSAWHEEAARAVLPGLRVVGQGRTPGTMALNVVASAGNWWVAERR